MPFIIISAAPPNASSRTETNSSNQPPQHQQEPTNNCQKTTKRPWFTEHSSSYLSSPSKAPTPSERNVPTPPSHSNNREKICQCPICWVKHPHLSRIARQQVILPVNLLRIAIPVAMETNAEDTRIVKRIRM